MLASQSSGANTVQNAAANRYAQFRARVQPSASYSAMAPSGPYASPGAVPYGFDPLSQSGQSLQAPTAAPFMPTKFGMIRRQPGTQPIDEWYAAQGNLIRGGRPADPTTMGHMDSAKYAAGLIATLAPWAAVSAALKAPAAARAIPEVGSAVDRIIGGSSAPVTNPNQLARLGEHANVLQKALAPPPTPRANPTDLLARIRERNPDFGTVQYNMERNARLAGEQAPPPTAPEVNPNLGSRPHSFGPPMERLGTKTGWVSPGGQFIEGVPGRFPGPEKLFNQPTDFAAAWRQTKAGGGNQPMYDQLSSRLHLPEMFPGLKPGTPKMPGMGESIGPYNPRYAPWSPDRQMFTADEIASPEWHGRDDPVDFLNMGHLQNDTNPFMIGGRMHPDFQRIFNSAMRGGRGPLYRFNWGGG